MLEFTQKISKKGLINTKFTIQYYDLSIEKEMRKFEHKNKMNGIVIITNVESGSYGCNNYNRLSKEYYYLATSYKDINNLTEENITFKNNINYKGEMK